MAFLVYLFVLVVAAGSIVFGLDLTQSPLQPPSYATPVAQTTDASATIAPAKIKTTATTGTASAAKTSAPATSAANPAGVAANAQASAEDTQNQPATTAAVSAPNHCAIEACAAAYHSFRASDCTYQPFGSERRLCTKGATTKKIAAVRPSAVHHASRSPADIRRAYDRRYAERDNARDSYAEPRRGWAFDLFGR